MITIDIFLDKFAEESGCSRERLKPETQFRRLENWTSLQALLILSMVEEEFGVLLKSEDFKNSQTLNDIFEIIAVQKK